MSKTTNNYIELAKQRIDWANAGINRLEELVKSYFVSKPCEITTDVEHKENNAYFTFRLHVINHPSPDISFAVGDVIHNLRSVLDNLIWGIGKDFKASDRIGLEFYDCERKFLECYLPKIFRLPQQVYDWIESIQPYHGKNIPRYSYEINRLWNLDKHRAPVLVNAASNTDTESPSANDLDFNIMTFFHRSSRENEQIIASASVLWRSHDDFKPAFKFYLAFSEDGPVGRNIIGQPQNIITYLHEVHNYILTRVIPIFEPFVKK
jgi:hypothetical protein